MSTSETILHIKLSKWELLCMKNVEYAGLAHYRRYFDIDINEVNVDKLMKGYDMMVVKGFKTLDFTLNKVNYTSHDEPYTRVIEHKHFEMFGQEVYDCLRTVVSEE